MLHTTYARMAPSFMAIEIRSILILLFILRLEVMYLVIAPIIPDSTGQSRMEAGFLIMTTMETVRALSVAGALTE